MVHYEIKASQAFENILELNGPVGRRNDDPGAVGVVVVPVRVDRGSYLGLVGDSAAASVDLGLNRSIELFKRLLVLACDPPALFTL